MTALCQARVSLAVLRCNAPAALASERDVPLCERCIRRRDEVDAQWGRTAKSPVFVPAEYKIDEPKAPKAPAKQSAADEELFAAMKRALANGFAKHEPAWTPEELATERSAA